MDQQVVKQQLESVIVTLNEIEGALGMLRLRFERLIEPLESAMEDVEDVPWVLHFDVFSPDMVRVTLRQGWLGSSMPIKLRQRAALKVLLLLAVLRRLEPGFCIETPQLAEVLGIPLEQVHARISEVRNALKNCPGQRMVLNEDGGYRLDGVDVEIHRRRRVVPRGLFTWLRKLPKARLPGDLKARIEDVFTPPEAA